MFTTGWDRNVEKVGAEAKERKSMINTQWIYPPSGAQATAMFSSFASVTVTLTGVANTDTLSIAPIDVEILAGTASTDPFVGDTFPTI